MKKRSDREDQLNDEALNSSPKKREQLDLAAMEISPVKYPDQDDLSLEFSTPVIRVAEILLSNIELLNSMGDKQFSSFEKLYSLDVTEGFELLEAFARRYEQLNEDQSNLREFCAEVDMIFDPDACEDYVIEGKLSIYNQLLQISARWNVINWITLNVQTIKTLHEQRSFYPHILAKLGIATTIINDEKVLLPKIEIEWLISLVQPLLLLPNPERNIARALSDRNQHSALLQFSAARPHINYLITHINGETGKMLPALLAFVLENEQFFRAVVTRELHQNFYDYIASCPHAAKLVENMMKHQLHLVSMLATRQFTHAPLTHILLDGQITMRLQILVKIAQITNQSTPEEKSLLTVLTWMEKHHEILALTLTPNNAWQKWIELTKVHKANVQSFAHGLLNILYREDAIDTRGITWGEQGELIQKPYASAQVCFQDAIAGLNMEDRSDGISCMTRDVLLFEFLRYNPAIVMHFTQHLEFMTTVVEEFKEHSVRKQAENVTMPLSPKKTNRSLQAELSPKALKPSPIQKKNETIDENDLANSVTFKAGRN